MKGRASWLVAAMVPASFGLGVVAETPQPIVSRTVAVRQADGNTRSNPKRKPEESFRVKQPCLEVDALARFQHELGGNHLQVRRVSAAAERRLIDSEAGNSFGLPWSDGIDRIAGNDENAAS